MAKTLKIAAIVIGVAALVVTGVGLAIGATAFAATFGIGATTLAAALSVTSSVLSLASAVLTKKPALASTGTQLDFIADPAAGLPYVMGDTRTGMNIVHEASWGDRNRYLGMIGVISCAGAIQSYDGLYMDNTIQAFSGRAATGYYANFLLLSTQLGARPEGSALTMTAPDSSAMPDWGSSSKMSSLAAAGLVMVADIDDGKIFSAGVPKMTHQVHGVKAYDARNDSTQTGGSGSQRALNETTYTFSENPWVHAETYALGRWVNGKKVVGPGVPVENMDFSAYMEAASVADAHGWTISGRIMSTDRKWEVLKALAQHGGGYPMPSGAMLSCLVNAPKVSLETIQEADCKGPVSVPQMSTRRSRFNGAVARYRSPTHAWEIVAADAIRNSTYLTEDGGKEHTKEIEFGLCKNANQAVQLAGYEVANSRERFPISVELSYYWSQYKLGDCLTLNIPSARLYNQKCVVIGRTINPSRNTITLEFRTETDAKHTWALGLSATAPPATTVTFPPGTGDGGAGLTLAQTIDLINRSWVTGLTFSIADTGAVTISNHTRNYSDKAVSVTGTGGTPHAVSGAVAGDRVYIFYDQSSRAGGAVTYQHLRLPGGIGDDSSVFASPTHPYRHLVCTGVVPATSGTTSGGSDYTGGGGDPGVVRAPYRY